MDTRLAALCAFPWRDAAGNALRQLPFPVRQFDGEKEIPTAEWPPKSVKTFKQMIGTIQGCNCGMAGLCTGARSSEILGCRRHAAWACRRSLRIDHLQARRRTRPPQLDLRRLRRRWSLRRGAPSLIETCKLDNVDFRAWLAGVLAKLPDHPARKIDELMPWAWKARREVLAKAQVAVVA